MTEDLHSPDDRRAAAHAGRGRFRRELRAAPGTAAGSGLPGPLANLPVEEHPEILVGAAFAGGIVAAFILKRLGR